MAIKVRREVNRSEGRLPEGEIIAGQPVTITADGKIKVYQAGDKFVYGLADVSSKPLPIADPSGAPTVGQGFDYTGFARGGLVGAFIDGGEFVVYDDGRGAPYDTTKTYTVGDKIYAGPDGKLTNDDGGGTNPLIGYVIEVGSYGLVIKVTEC